MAENPSYYKSIGNKALPDTYVYDCFNFSFSNTITLFEMTEYICLKLNSIKTKIFVNFNWDYISDVTLWHDDFFRFEIWNLCFIGVTVLFVRINDNLPHHSFKYNI